MPESQIGRGVDKPEASERVSPKDYVQIFRSDQPFQLHVNTVDNAVEYWRRRIIRSGLLAHTTGTDRGVLWAMADCVNNDHWQKTGEMIVWPAVSTIARRIGANAGDVSRSRQRMVEFGLFKVIAKGGGRDSAVYQLILQPEHELDSPTYRSESQIEKQLAIWESVANPLRQRKAGGDPLRQRKAPSALARSQVSSPANSTSAPARGQPARPRATTENKTLWDDVQENKQQMPVDVDSVELLKREGFAQPAAEQIARHPNCTPEQIRIAVALRADSKTPVVDPLAWLRRAIEEKWLPAARPTAADRRRAAQPEHVQEEQAAKELGRANVAAQESREAALIKDMTDEDLVKWMAEAVETAPCDMIRKLWQTNTVKKVRDGRASSHVPAILKLAGLIDRKQ